MDNQEIEIIKKYCRGNRKKLYNINPMGIDFETPIGRFIFIFQIGIAEMGFVYMEESSNENTKMYLNAERKMAFLLMISSKSRLTEINRVTLCDDYDNQLNHLEDTMSQYVELFGAPHEWVKLNDDITACSWDASNGNSLSIGFNRATCEIVCKYLRSQLEE